MNKLVESKVSLVNDRLKAIASEGVYHFDTNELKYSIRSVGDEYDIEFTGDNSDDTEILLSALRVVGVNEERILTYKGITAQDLTNIILIVHN